MPTEKKTQPFCPGSRDLNWTGKGLMCYIPSVFIVKQEMQYTLSKTQYSFYKHNQLQVSANDDSHDQADHKKINSKFSQLHWLLEILSMKILGHQKP
jgi:hypothetical protein